MCDGQFNIDERVLCPDGNCIGLVGPDGKCKVCGLAYAGEYPLPKAESPSELLDMMNLEKAPAPPPAASTAEEADAEERICCVDDNCIGIIGMDGRCGICGKSLSDKVE